MARVERLTSTGKVPVEQAQRIPLIDPSGFEFSTAEADAVGGIGNILVELGKRKIAAQDSTSLAQISASHKLAELQRQEFMTKNPVDKWEQGFAQIASAQGKSIIGLPLSKEAQVKAGILQDSFTDGYRLSGSILETKKIVDDDVKITGSAFILDPTEENEAAAREALSRTETPDIVDIEMAALQKEASKAFWEEKSKLFPEDTIKAMQAKKKALGKKRIGEDGLDATDYDAIIGLAIAAQNQAKRISDDATREAKIELYKKEDEGAVLTRDDFNNAWTDPVDADQHYDEYIRGQIAEQKGEVNFIKNGDPIILARTEAVIDLNPMAITEDQLHEFSTRGIGTENVTGLVDRLRKAQEGFFAQITKYNTQFSTLLNAKYFGDKDEAETSVRYLEMKRKMSEFIDSQTPNEATADAFFAGLITKNFKGFFRGGFEEKGFKHSFIDAEGKKVTQRFRFGDIRSSKVDGKVINEFYAGSDDKGDALWLPRR